MKKIFFILSLFSLVTLASCGTTTPSLENSGATNTGTNTTETSSGSDTVVSGDVVTLNYTLRDGSIDGPVIETTVESVAREAGIYSASGSYAPVKMMIASGSVIPGFYNEVLGMKVGEEKAFTVPPELGYTPKTQEVPLYTIAPVFTMPLDRSVIGDVVEESILLSDLQAAEGGQAFLDELAGKKVGDTITGPTGMKAKITALTDTGVTVSIENTQSPFYGKGLAVGTEGVDSVGNTYIIKSVDGDKFNIEIHNISSPFTPETFVAGSKIDLNGESLKIISVGADTAVIEESSAQTGKTLYFDVEVVAIDGAIPPTTNNTNTSEE